MESLSPDCTPLKHRYDSCFNLWFEGYLQPALDGQRVTSSAANSSLSTSTPAPQLVQPPSPLQTPSNQGPHRPITNWASAFPDPRRHAASSQTLPESAALAEESEEAVESTIRLARVDTRGKTRAQIKAEEYERSCGEAWKDYQACLKRAIRDNESLSTLLQQARDEHPLRSQEGLAGTAWDPKTDFSAAT